MDQFVIDIEEQQDLLDLQLVLNVVELDDTPTERAPTW